MPKSTQSSPSSKSSRKTARISVRPCCFVKLNSSSSDSSPLTISSPIRDENVINLSTPVKQPSPIATTPPTTKTPIASTPPPAPSQPPRVPTPKTTSLAPLELFSTPPSSPHPWMDSLEDLPPRSTNPPPLPSFASIERIAHEPPRASFMPNEMMVDQTQHQSFTPLYREIDDSMWVELPPPNTQEKLQLLQERRELNQELNGLYAFTNIVDSHIEAMNIQQALLSSSNVPPPSFQTTNAPPSSTNLALPPDFPRHGCSHCERTARLSERTKIMVHELQDEMRFILNHILERLNALSHPPPQ